MANGVQQRLYSPPASGVTNPLSLRYLNETRAGSKGFLQRSGNKIVHSLDPTNTFTIRGTTMSQQGFFPPAAEADAIAQRMADHGINWCRFQGDSALRSTSSSGNFWDSTAADYITFDTTADPNNFMDRWDYFRNALADKGIYGQYMLSYLRRYLPAQRPVPYQADTWPGTNSYGVGLFWMEPIKTYHREYWTRLLTRVNPYTPTKCAPIDDPSVALVGIQNEDGVFNAWLRTNLYWSPVNLTGQLRADLIARWSAYAQTQGLGAYTELIAPSGAAWGTAPTWSTATTAEKNAWTMWLLDEEANYYQEQYTWFRTLGVKCLIMFSTANYCSKYNNPTDIYDIHMYDNSVTSGTTTDTTNLTRTLGSPVGTVASAGTIAKGHSISGATGFPIDTSVIDISGTTVTFDQNATSSGTTSTAFVSPLQLANPNHIESNHTISFWNQCTKFRDPYKPFAVLETNLHGKPILGATWFGIAAILGNLQDINGQSCFNYYSGFGYPPAGLDENDSSFNGDTNINHNPVALLTWQAASLLNEKKYVSPLTNWSTVVQNTTSVRDLSVTLQRTSASLLDYGAITQSVLVAKEGISWSSVSSDDTTASYVSPSVASLDTNVLTITNTPTEKLVWDRTSTSGTTITHESPYTFIMHNIMKDYTSSINGISVTFPTTLSQTCTTTLSSNVVTVTDASAWSLNDHVIIAGVKFTSSNKQRIARVADINTGTNQLTLVTQGGVGGIVDATCDAAVGPGAAITRVQQGTFQIISMDGNPLGYGKAMVLACGDFWPIGFHLISNSEVAAANLRKFSNYANRGVGNRPYVECLVGKFTMPRNVNFFGVNDDGTLVPLSTGSTCSFSKYPAYLINP